MVFYDRNSMTGPEEEMLQALVDCTILGRNVAFTRQSSCSDTDIYSSGGRRHGQAPKIFVSLGSVDPPSFGM